ncbi:MAG: UpxY family transcription antiterminator [Flavobacteriaceae bacterium]|jgi:transcriptional antiterminator RfaH|nr:UpxY family transcription antiterminator [Flavobacteriaceae bacterium]
MYWFALYTRPKNEKKVAFCLEKMGIEAYCPMINQVKQWSDRKKKVEIPLINSYVFVKINDLDRHRVFEVPGVVRYLFWLGKPAIIQEHEILALKDSLNEIVSSVEVEGLKTGDVLTISKGPFIGKEGVVSQIEKNKIRLVLKELGVLITITKE